MHMLDVHNNQIMLQSTISEEYLIISFLNLARILKNYNNK